MEEKLNQADDLKDRVEAFNKELKELLGKYELGMNAVSFITQEWGKVQIDGVETLIPPGIIAARPQLVDMKRKEAPSQIIEG